MKCNDADLKVRPAGYSAPPGGLAAQRPLFTQFVPRAPSYASAQSGPAGPDRHIRGTLALSDRQNNRGIAFVWDAAAGLSKQYDVQLDQLRSRRRQVFCDDCLTLPRPDKRRRTATLRTPEIARRDAEPDRPVFAAGYGDHRHVGQHGLVPAVTGHLDVAPVPGEVM